jgi:hypothetical protein
MLDLSPPPLQNRNQISKGKSPPKFAAYNNGVSLRINAKILG